MFISRIIAVIVLSLNIFSINAIQVLSKLNRSMYVKKMLRTSVRTLFYKKNPGEAGIGTPIFNKRCCQQEYYVKDGKAHRIFQENILLPDDLCYGYSVQELDGRKIIETNQVSEHHKKRIEYLEKLLPQNMFPVIAFSTKKGCNGQVWPLRHVIVLSETLGTIIDSVLQKQSGPVVLEGVHRFNSWSFPITIARAIVTNILWHELGHMYFQHDDTKTVFEEEMEADEFSASILEGIVGGISLQRIGNVEVVGLAHAFSRKRDEIKKICPKEAYYSFFGVSSSNHPSHVERLEIFQRALTQFLAESSAYVTIWESLKKEIDTISFVSETPCTLSDLEKGFEIV